MALDPMRPIVRGIQKILGVPRLAPASRAAPRKDLAPSESTLAWLGFPQVTGTTFYPSAAAGERLRAEQSLVFPSMCCVCGAPPSVMLAPVQLRGWFERMVPGPLVACIPHCAAHAERGHASLLVRLHPVNEPAWHVSLIGFHTEFLRQTYTLNVQGEPWPPWVVFPMILPEGGGWRQGDG
ncbi:MAG: hypothetical protein ABW321_01020, partial [Polyangiales bacterium]